MNEKIRRLEEQAEADARGNFLAMSHPGPLSYGQDHPLDELREARRREREDAQMTANEIGVSLAEYRRLQEQDRREQEDIRVKQANGYYAREAAIEQAAMRAEIGLPADVLPTASLIRVNGGVYVVFEGRFITGAFSVGANGRPIVNGQQW